LKSKLIVRAEVTDASVHDSPAIDSVTRAGDAETWLDAGYVGEGCETILADKGIQAKICEKGACNRPLTAKQKRSNPGEVTQTFPGRACLRIYDDEHESDGEAAYRQEKETVHPSSSGTWYTTSPEPNKSSA
jgi:hypothetical protein